MIKLLAVMDGEGVYGTFLSYGLTTAMAGGALILFIYFWAVGRLDMDEEPKYQMLKGDETGEDDVTPRA